MNKSTRIQEIAKIQKQTEESKDPERIRIRWKDENVPMVVCQIPLECLVYNKYNGRILSRTKSLEKHGPAIDVETPEGKKIIEDLLWRSKENRNETTKKDLEEKGQLKVGIVTKDGIIIDGNRRAMLLNKIKKFDYFRAVVLPVEHDTDPIEIEKLETEYQMGEDEKLGYNPIEKYLKAHQLYTKLTESFSHKEAVGKIADWMGESAPEIEHYLGVVKIIDSYLEYLGYDGIYAMADTPNDGKEDLFLYLKKWLDAFRDKESNKGFDGYTNNDVAILETICFDYIRAKIGRSYDGKIFRNIADGQKQSHFFGNKQVWESFRDTHRKNIEPVIDKIDSDIPVSAETANMEAYLSDRDTKFKDSVLEPLTENIRTHITELGYNRAADKPLELVNDAKKALSAIDRTHTAFSDPDVMDKVEELNKITIEMLNGKSPKRVLSEIVEMLNVVDVSKASDEKEEMLDKVREINQITFEMKKKLGG